MISVSRPYYLKPPASLKASFLCTNQSLKDGRRYFISLSNMQLFYKSKFFFRIGICGKAEPVINPTVPLMAIHSETNKPVCSNDSSLIQKIASKCTGNFDQASLGSDDSGISCSSNNAARSCFKSTSTEDISVSTLVSQESLAMNKQNSEDAEAIV